MTEIITRIKADTSEMEHAFRSLNNLSAEFSTQLSQGMKNAVFNGNQLEDVLKKISLNIAGMALKQGLQPLSNVFSGMFTESLGKGLFSNVMPFANGGVISTPTYFPMSGGVGVAGEAGSEAILPLKRGTDGTLGVSLSAGGPAVHVVFNVQTQDSFSFRKSEAQITEMLARAVQRGTKSF